METVQKCTIMRDAFWCSLGLMRMHAASSSMCPTHLSLGGVCSDSRSGRDLGSVCDLASKATAKPPHAHIHLHGAPQAVGRSDMPAANTGSLDAKLLLLPCWRLPSHNACHVHTVHT